MMMRIIIGVVLAVLYSMIWISAVHALEIGQDFGVAYYTWSEDTSLGTVKESGPIWILNWSVSSPVPMEKGMLVIHSDFQIFGGQVDYDTKTQLGVPVNTNTDYLGFKIEGSAGWRTTFRQSDADPSAQTDTEPPVRAYVEPFLGLAFRFWDRIIESSISSQGTPVTGNPELYSTLYARIGLRTSYKLTSNAMLHGTLSLDPMLLAREKADVGGILILKNGKRIGWEIETGALIEKFNLAAYWQATRFGKSDVVGCCYQPKSDQDIIGIKFGYLF